ncbi:MAG: LysM peptidoglycan-binding domain-containing protein, partial [Solirubrobacteraceae bacterium]
RLPAADFEAPGDAAKGVVDAAFGDWIATAAMTPSQSAARHGFSFRASGPGQTLFDAYDPAARVAAGVPISHEDLALWAAQHDGAAGRILDRHNFDPGQSGSDMETFFFDEIVAPWAPPGSATRRDLELWDRFGFAFTSGNTRDRVSIYTSARQVPGGPAGPSGVNTESERATRWDGFMTLAHEYVHTLEHPAFTAARSAGPSVMNEGFCEMFTKEVMDAVIPGAPGDAALRAKVEGGAYPPPAPPILDTTYTSPASYVADRNAAIAIKGRIGDRGVKAAYFQGHVEYLGIDPTGTPLAAVPAAADEVAVPPGVADVAALSTASGVPEADIRTSNPGIAPPLPARARLPGCREHVVVQSTDAGGVSVVETKSQIARQNGVLEAELDRANPGRNWGTLRQGDKILIPRH